jgi:hypothetical protein
VGYGMAASLNAERERRVNTVPTIIRLLERQIQAPAS